MRRFRFKPEPTGVRTDLGDLERVVMEVLWECDVCTAGEVHRQVLQTHQVALTTIATTLERLCRKGLVERSGERRSYRYRAVLSREQLERRIVGEALAHLAQRFPEVLAAYFHRVPEEVSPEVLQRWAEEIRRLEEEEG
ncbi:MAG: BlaI/MecI/CopY family transcriptional regulator [Armatimonadota bacterium]